MALAFPRNGVSADAIGDELAIMRTEDSPWDSFNDRWLNDRGLLVDDGVLDVTRRAHAAFFTKGNGHAAVLSMQADLVDMVKDLLNGPDANGVITSCGTESLFLATRTALDWKRRHGPGLDEPELVMPATGYPAFEKFAPVLGYRVRRIPTDHGFRADVAAIEAALNDQTFLIVASVPPWAHGVCDPVGDLAGLARARGVWLHVDACVGAFVAPFVKRLGRPVPAFDFSVPGVSSISGDFHKFGYAPKGVSAVLWSSPELSDGLGFAFSNWAAGLYRSGVLTGTRSGGAIAGAWAAMRYLGEDGFTERTKAILNAKDKLVAAIDRNRHLELYGEPELATLSFGGRTIDIFAVHEALRDRGWPLLRCQDPDGIQVVLGPFREHVIDQLATDLDAATELVRRTGRRRRGNAVVYADEVVD